MSLLLAAAAAPAAAAPSYADDGSNGDYEAPDHLDPAVFENYADTPQPAAATVADQVAQYDATIDQDEPEDDAGIYPAYWAQPPPDDQHGGAEDASGQLLDEDEFDDWASAPLAFDEPPSGQSDTQSDDEDEPAGFEFVQSLPDDPPGFADDASTQALEDDEPEGWASASLAYDEPSTGQTDVQDEDEEEQFGFAFAAPDEFSADPLFAQIDQPSDDEDEHEGWYVAPLQDDGGVPVIPVIAAGAAGLGYLRRRAPSAEELVRLHEAQTARRLDREGEEAAARTVAAQLELEAAAKAARLAYEASLKQVTLEQATLEPERRQTSSQRRKALETARKEAEKAEMLAELARAYEIRITIIEAQDRNDAIVLEEEEWLMLIAADQSSRLI